MIAFLWLSGCGPFGTVEQGRAVAFDAASDQVTVALDRSADPRVPDYTGEIHTYTLPHDPAERKPDPTPGGLLAVDVRGSSAVLTVFDGEKRREVTLSEIEISEGVDRKDPGGYPKREGETLALWLPRERRLVTGRLPPEDASLPIASLTSGDEVRLYILSAPQIARFMNVTRTDIYKK